MDAQKSEKREEIRKRIRNTEVPQEAVLIPPLPSPTIQDSNIKRVAAYTRVSTTSIEQVSSIENQTKYYTDAVAKRSEWELYKIYSDEGKSGTSRKRREEFNQMLEDAKAQKFDLIMCASVSRFARNVKDFLQVIKNLKNQNPMHPVGVYFETENCYTLNSDSESILDMHAMFAAWESRNKSLRMILSYDQRICTGQYPLADLLGFRHTQDGRLIIVPEEAKTVRFIYLAYIGGYSLSEIARILTEKKRSTLKGRTEWTSGMVRAIMLNERRWGDLNARKTIVIDYEERIVIKNEGVQRRYAATVPNHHEAIVSRDIANVVKVVRNSSSSLGKGIHEVAVVKIGRLKGFVSIFPSWAGVNQDLLCDVSLSAYENEPLITAASACEYLLPTNSMVISNSVPVLKLSKNKIALNKRAIESFREYSFMEMLYHPYYKILCIRSCDEESSNSFSLIKNNGYMIKEFLASGIASVIQELNLPEQRIRGVVRKKSGVTVMMFYLDDGYLDILNDIDYEDMIQESEYMCNPLVGDLPKRSDILNEVDELLSTM